MEKIKIYLNKSFKTNVTIGISRVCSTLKNLRVANIQAEEALKYKFSVGTNQIINADDILDRDTIGIGSNNKRYSKQVNVYVDCREYRCSNKSD